MTAESEKQQMYKENTYKNSKKPELRKYIKNKDSKKKTILNEQ